MLQPLEPLVLLTAVPGEVVIAVAGPIGLAFAGMAKGMHLLYVNGRQDGVAAISALKDATHAIDKQSTAIEKQTAVIKELAAIVQKDALRRAAGD